MELCSKPGCSRPGAAELSYDYARRTARLDDPTGPRSPHRWVLCPACAGRLRPPRGWVLLDRRIHPPLFILPWR